MLSPPLRVTFIIRRFVYGGAERQLVELLKHLDRTRIAPSVICLYPGGGLWDELAAIDGLEVLHLGKSGRWDFTALLRIVAHLRRLRPNVVHGYMDVANLIALAGKALGAKVVWGVRASRVDLQRYDWVHRLAARVEIGLSRAADLAICNSEAGKADALSRGMRAGAVVVIPNGIDTARFHRDEAARGAVRQEWGLSPSELLVGLPARLDPMKGHAVFVAAAALVGERFRHAKFVCIGDGPAQVRGELQALVGSHGLADRFVWAGERPDMPRVLAALDVAVSASLFGEGFSNALGEAMACGVPCVATQVGDSARVLGGTGWLVPPEDAPALATALCSALQAVAAGTVDGTALRSHIESNFSVRMLAQRTEHALQALVAGRVEVR
ncbi:MAG TPA: glycosyltransferase [Steroidobacteraceae bacterium]|jgi:glycosyltransferase involved in cell wall biosynthesis|nr:glycosyltransferase [Steroidobacteraceae bacterium]